MLLIYDGLVTARYARSCADPDRADASIQTPTAHTGTLHYIGEGAGRFCVFGALGGGAGRLSTGQNTWDAHTQGW
jgi:hypothetical protein